MRFPKGEGERWRRGSIIRGVHGRRACLLQAVDLGLQVGHRLHAALAQPLGSPSVALAPARC